MKGPLREASPLWELDPELSHCEPPPGRPRPWGARLPGLRSFCKRCCPGRPCMRPLESVTPSWRSPMARLPVRIPLPPQVRRAWACAMPGAQGPSLLWLKLGAGHRPSHPVCKHSWQVEPMWSPAGHVRRIGTACSCSASRKWSPWAPWAPAVLPRGQGGVDDSVPAGVLGPRLGTRLSGPLPMLERYSPL